MVFGDVMIASRHAQPMGSDHAVGVAESLGCLELVAGQFDLEPTRVLHLDGVHESTVALDELDAALAQPFGGQHEGGARNVEGDVFHAPDLARGRPCRDGARLVGKHGQQSPVAGIEVQVVFVGLAEVGLLENKGHAEYTLPEVERALSGGANQRDVMDSLHLDLLHGCALG